jgi:hypothetical protein
MRRKEVIEGGFGATIGYLGVGRDHFYVQNGRFGAESAWNSQNVYKMINR